MEREIKKIRVSSKKLARTITSKQLEQLIKTGVLSMSDNNTKKTSLCLQKDNEGMSFLVCKKGQEIRRFGNKSVAIVVIKKGTKFKKTQETSLNFCNLGLIGETEIFESGFNEILVQSDISIEDLHIIILQSGIKLCKKLGFKIPKRPKWVANASDLTEGRRHTHGWLICQSMGIKKV